MTIPSQPTQSHSIIHEQKRAFSTTKLSIQNYLDFNKAHHDLNSYNNTTSIPHSCTDLLTLACTDQKDTTIKTSTFTMATMPTKAAHLKYDFSHMEMTQSAIASKAANKEFELFYFEIILIE